VSADFHNAGNKTRLALQPGVVGDAEFRECGGYRLGAEHGRSRTTSATATHSGSGWNSSTAEAGVGAPTIPEDRLYEGDGALRNLKCDVMDYRATDPRTLLSVTPQRQEISNASSGMPRARHA
jgi:hypothetical protein